MLDLPPVTVHDALRFDQLRPEVVIKAAVYLNGICGEKIHGQHHLHVPSTSSVTVHGAELERDSASNAIIYDIAFSRIPTIRLAFVRL